MKWLFVVMITFLSAFTLAGETEVYFLPQQVLNSSQVIHPILQQKLDEFEKQRSELFVKMEILQNEINKRESANLDLSDLASEQNTLRDDYAKLNSNIALDFSHYKNKYFVFVDKATKQLSQQKHYKFVTNIESEAINVSTEVSTIADKLYLKANY